MEPFGIMSHRARPVKVEYYNKAYFLVTMKFNFQYIYEEDINSIYDTKEFTKEWCKKWTAEEVVKDTFCKYYIVSDPKWVDDDVIQFKINNEGVITSFDIHKEIEYTYLIDEIYNNGLVNFWVVPRCLNRVT